MNHSVHAILLFFKGKWSEAVHIVYVVKMSNSILLDCQYQAKFQMDKHYPITMQAMKHSNMSLAFNMIH